MIDHAAPQAAVPAGEAEFRELFQDYAPRLRAYFLRRGASPSAAEELVQDVMLTVWNKADSFDPKRATLSTWIYTIARNRFVDRLRRRRAEPDPADPLFLEDTAAKAEDSDATMAVADHQRRLRAAIDELPEELKSLLFALYYEGKSMSEVAAETAVALGTIKTRARRALAALRERMGNER